MQWRICSTKTLSTTQTRQRKTRWAERHRESRRYFRKSKLCFQTSRPKLDWDGGYIVPSCNVAILHAWSNVLHLFSLKQRCRGTNIGFRCFISTWSVVLGCILVASYLYCPVFMLIRTAGRKSESTRAHRQFGFFIIRTDFDRPTCPN